MPINGNVADLVLAQLAEWGVKRIYGVLSDAIFPLLDAIARQDKIKFIAATREDSAAFMASYEARVTGKIAVCATGAGPGAVTMLNGLADAFMDGVPVLAITGQLETKKMGTGTKQYFDQQALFRTFSGRSAIIIDPANVTRELIATVRYAYLHFTTGHISIPKDIFTKAISSEIVPVDYVEVKTTPPVTGNIEKILDATRCFHKPLVVLGRQSKTVTSQV
ncbi:MAG: thiamine pyrophosphate-binding protein [Desulfotomaculaceae bacterium]|nr:thiamine pyrophosphate-binding protein [Desulfotomaculaceae bacterium]